ncbi:MAG: carboxymuconolactone decarboxylase family protein, partial [Actinomycetota bacterium]
TPEQRALWDELVASRGGAMSLVGPDGALVGPFNHMVASPNLGKRMGDLGHAVRFEASVERRLQELAIVTVGAHWRSNFEFWAHARMALEQGIDRSVIDALAAGDTPNFEQADEAEVHRLASQLVATGRVEQASYDAVRDRLGEQALVDLITTVGYYSLISLTLNAHQVPMPEGEAPIWTDENP